MNNKKFLIFAVVIAVAGFIGFRMMNNKQAATSAQEARVSDDLLIKFHSPIKGNMNAPVTVVEFLDPECEACRAMHPVMKKLLQEYDGKIKLVIRYMPLHANSVYASSALEEAKEQNKFEEALDVLFETQPEWGDHHEPRPELIAKNLAKIGVKIDHAKKAELIEKHGAKVEIDRKDAVAVGVNGTPTFFINGVKRYQIGYEPIKMGIDEALAALPK